LKSINDDILSNGRCNNGSPAISCTDQDDSNKRLDFQCTSPYLIDVQCDEGNAMTKERCPTLEVPIPDLLAALTAYGLGGANSAPHSGEGPAESPAAPRSWLGRLQQTFARDGDVGAAPGSPDFDDEWAGGSYARSRRLLEAALRAARQRKGIL
jgi:hypothetical protein